MNAGNPQDHYKCSVPNDSTDGSSPTNPDKKKKGQLCNHSTSSNLTIPDNSSKGPICRSNNGHDNNSGNPVLLGFISSSPGVDQNKTDCHGWHVTPGHVHYLNHHHYQDEAESLVSEPLQLQYHDMPLQVHSEVEFKPTAQGLPLPLPVHSQWDQILLRESLIG